MIKSHNISDWDVKRWSSRIKKIVKSLPYGTMVPDVHVHQTMISAVHAHLDPADPDTDEIIMAFLRDDNWAFSVLPYEGHEDDGVTPCVVLALNRRYIFNDSLPPEFVFMHEVAHHNMNVQIDCSNKMDVEIMCDKLGLSWYVRFLRRHPRTVTISEFAKQIHFENQIKTFLKREDTNAMSIAEVADAIMDKLNWINLFYGEE